MESAQEAPGLRRYSFRDHVSILVVMESAQEGALDRERAEEVLFQSLL